MLIERKEVDLLLVDAANSVTAINRLRSDLKREYKPGSDGLRFVLDLLYEIERFNDNATVHLQELSDAADRKDKRGNMSLTEMERERQAALDSLEEEISYWDARIERKKARMNGSQNVTPFVERRRSN